MKEERRRAAAEYFRQAAIDRPYDGMYQLALDELHRANRLVLSRPNKKNRSRLAAAKRELKRVEKLRDQHCYINH